MSEISERIIRGQYVSKAECFEHAEEVERTMGCYGAAMAAMEEHERKMQDCVCDWDVDGRIPVVGCTVHAEEDEE